MAQGSSNARLALYLGLAIFCLLNFTKPAVAVEYTVGNGAGWNININYWPNGKKFKKEHNVVQVMTEQDFNSCKVTGGAKYYNSGNDRITLDKAGQYYYFICTFPGHCENGMKIAIIAS
ncbi:Chemocyanin [Bienertia sinuspersici]